jgi:small subunit ribosomal protein S13
MSRLFREGSLPEREIRCSLRKIPGVGWRTAILAASKLGLSFPLHINQLNGYNFSFLSTIVKLGVVGHALVKRRVEFDIARLVGISGVKGLRHKLCLPVHGQRTHTNAGTQRSKRVHIKRSPRVLITKTKKKGR